MSKEYYKKRLVDLRAEIAREREAKKRDNANYASLIKNSSNTSTKATYRKNKIDKAAAHERRIEYLKNEVERTRDALKRCK